MANDIQKMEDTIWEGTRQVSDGSMTASSEQLALISFVYRLGSLAMNNDESGIADENDVRKEARLLMSLSCSSPMTVIEELGTESGRVTPQSDVSMCSGTSSRSRSSFSFACPSLSLENHSQLFSEDVPPSKLYSEEESRPAVLLGRVLKVDDVDATRLSSEAMARNVMQSYQKAIDWRIKTWVESLSKVLYQKEATIKAEGGASEAKLKDLLNTSEARLLLQFRDIQNKVQVMDARTSFKVLPQRVTQASASEPETKRRRLEDTEDDGSGLEETEYQYEVAHTLSLEASLNILTPGAGYVQIDLQLPGTIKGTFQSSELESEVLTDVMIELDTDILASMIEKSSRLVVRSSVQALLEQSDESKKEAEGLKQEDAVTATKSTPPPTETSVTPKRKRSAAPNPVFVTPRDSAPPPPFSVKDCTDKPLLLSIPDNFGHDEAKRGLHMLSPQPSRPHGSSTFSLQKRPSTSEREVPQMVTPVNQTKQAFITKGKGPNLPVLVEVACAAMDAR